MATSLLGPSRARRGSRGGLRLWWSCPFHHDPNPSFCVEEGSHWFRCYGCGERGDAAALAMRVLNLSFPDAVRHLTGDLPGLRGPDRPAAVRLPRKPAVPADNLPRDAAERLVDDATGCLHSEAGRHALDYLTGRGLSEGTIAAARLGLTLRPLDMPGGPTGLVIPWFLDGELALVKLRQPRGRRPKYRQVFVDPALHAGLYPGPEAVRPGRPLIVAEGEFDCLLLAQQLGHFDVGVVTLGSASARPTPAILSALLPASPWYMAPDADEAGDRFAAAWPSTARRIRPPAPDKDWTETHAGGWGRLAYFWGGWLGLPAPDTAIGDLDPELAALDIMTS